VDKIVEKCDIVLLSLPTPTAVEAVVGQLVDADPSDLIVVEMGTLSIEEPLCWTLR